MLVYKLDLPPDDDHYPQIYKIEDRHRLLEQIENELDLIGWAGDNLNFKIEIIEMTQEELNALPILDI